MIEHGQEPEIRYKNPFLYVFIIYRIVLQHAIDTICTSLTGIFFPFTFFWNLDRSNVGFFYLFGSQTIFFLISYPREYSPFSLRRCWHAAFYYFFVFESIIFFTTNDDFFFFTQVRFFTTGI